MTVELGDGLAAASVVGEADLCRLYARALAACGRIAVVETGDAASRGLARIGGLAPWT